jgi:hypothetical protein
VKASSVLIDDEVLAVLKEHAEPFVDTPNSVLRRLLGMSPMNGSGPTQADRLVHEPAEPSKAVRQGAGQRRRRRRRSASTRAQTGTILPHDEYEIPILEILDSHDGRAPTREVLDELEGRLSDHLMPADFDRL